MRFLVMIRRTTTGYSVDVPDLIGCVATGDTVEKAQKNITQAIRMHLEIMRQSGEVIPEPTRRIEFVIDETSPEEICTWVEVAIPEAVV